MLVDSWSMVLLKNRAKPNSDGCTLHTTCNPINHSNRRLDQEISSIHASEIQLWLQQEGKQIVGSIRLLFEFNDLNVVGLHVIVGKLGSFT